MRDVILSTNVANISWTVHLTNKKFYKVRIWKETFASNKKETVNVSRLHNEESELVEFNTHKEQRKQEKQMKSASNLLTYLSGYRNLTTKVG